VTLSSSEYAQLTDLFNLLPRLDALLPIIPPLLARLSSLSALHAEAADMAVRLGKADAGDTEDKEAEADMRFMLAGVQQGLRDGTATIQDNWKAVDSRLEQLKQRLAKLE
jgi:nuclear migration protein JNM1